MEPDSTADEAGKARHARLEQLFLSAADLSPEQQSAFVSRECADDPELGRMLNALLAEDRHGPLLPQPPAIASGSDGVGSPDLSGLQISHYQVVQRIATGGMAAVYRAIDTRLRRTVALKVVPERAMGDESALRRFWREARSVASIDHPNVCPVYEIDEAGDLLFIAMAYLDGTPLVQRIRRGPLQVEDALEIAIQAARGLDAAHANGIIHRDIKPGNLMLSDTGTGKLLVRILDFGIAHWRGEAPLTQAGLTMGTVSYMAPEQIDQTDVDARADI
jgi:serine/threonine protein kinase